MVYQDGATGAAMVKRFAVSGITRDKEYDLTMGTKGSKVLYFSANPNGEAEVIHVKLRPRNALKKLRFDFDFSSLTIKGRAVKGNTLSKYVVNKIELKEKGTSTLAPRKIWFDDVVQRLNADGRGTYIGSFKGEDKILTIYQKGYYRTTGFDLGLHFDEEMVSIEKHDPNMVITAVYWEGEKGQYNVKRFQPEVAQKLVTFITEHPESLLDYATTHPQPVLNIVFDKRSNERLDEQIDLNSFISVKGVSAMGNRLTTLKVKAFDRIEPEIETPEPEPEAETDETVSADEENETSDENVPEIKTEPPKEGGQAGQQVTLF